MTLPANQSHLSLRIGGTPFDVLGISGEETLNQPFCFKVSVVGGWHQAAERLGSSVFITMTAPDGFERWVNGVLTRVEADADLADGQSILVLTVESALSLLSQQTDSRMIVSRTTAEIIRDTICRNDIDGSCLKFHLSRDYPVRPITLQAQESDLDFVLRLAGKSGLMVWSDSEDADEIIHIADSSNHCPMLDRPPLPWLPETGTETTAGGVKQVGMLSIIDGAQRVPDHHWVHDVYENAPDHPMFAGRATELSAEQTRAIDFAIGVKTHEEAEHQALIRAQRSAAIRHTVTVRTRAADLRAGAMVRIDAAGFADDLSGDYLIVSVTHKSRQYGAYNFSGKKDVPYTNTAVLIPREKFWRPEIKTIDELPQVFTARIESQETMAELDTAGRYRYRQYSDREERVSPPVRRVQPYLSPTGDMPAGWHLPLHADNEVLVGCLNNDPDRPMLVGTLANPAHRSVVTSENAHQNRLLTAGYNELCMDDWRMAPSITYCTFEGQTMLHLNADVHGHRINLAAMEGTMQMYAQKTMTTDAGDTITETVGNDRVRQVENRHATTTKKGNIHHQARTDALVEAGGNVRLDAQGNIEFTAGRDFHMDITEATRIHVKEKDAVIRIDSGSLNITADGAIDIRGDGSGDILFAQNDGGFLIAPNGDITLFGHDISIKADEINFNGPVTKEIGTPPPPPTMAALAPLSPTAIPNINEKGELEELANFVDLEYLYTDGTGVAGASYTAKDMGGNVLAEGTLDKEGKAHVDLPIDPTRVQVLYHDDPEDVDIIRPSEPSPMKVTENWLERMTGYLTEAWDNAKDSADWTWGMLRGKFNEDATIGQLATNAIITAVPLTDQTNDARDLTAGIKMLAWDNRHEDDEVWFGFFITLAGLLPETGSLLKGELKLINDGAGPDDLIHLFNHFMKGNGVKWLKALKEGGLTGHAKEAAKNGHKILDRLIEIIGDVKEKIPEKLQNLHTKTDGVLKSLKQVKSGMDSRFDDIARDLSEKLGRTLDEGEGSSVGGGTRRMLSKKQSSQPPDDTPMFEDAFGPDMAELNKQANNSPKDVNMGHPVNAVTGAVVETVTDFTVPGRIPLVWERHYSSQTQEKSLLGVGWQCPADARLLVDRDGYVTVHFGTKTAGVFSRLPDAELPVVYDASKDFSLSSNDTHYIVTGRDRLSRHFPKTEGKQPSYLERITDSFGSILQFTRDKNGLSAITDTAGLHIRVTSDDGRIEKMVRVLPDGNETPLITYGYDPETEDLISVTDITDVPIVYAYKNHCLIRLMFRSGLTFQYEYDRLAADGKALRTWGDDNLYHYRFEYDEEARKTRIVNSLGETEIIAYDENYKPVLVTDHAGHETRYAYNAQGRPTSVTDPLGRETKYDYDARGNVTGVTRPDGSVIRMDYDGEDNPVAVTDPNGNKWQQEFEDRSLLTRRISPTGSETQYEYNSIGELVSVTAPNGGKTSLKYDIPGHITGIVHADGTTERFEHDPLGNITTAYDPLSNKTEYVYDDASRLIRIIKPSGDVIAFEYDLENRLVSHTDEAGHTTRLSYTGLDRIMTRINPDGTKVSYTYDTEERLKSLTNERGEHYAFERDHAGRILSEIDYWGNERKYTYDPAGQLLQSIDPLNRVIRYVTDDLGRLIEKSFQDGSSEKFVFDPNGNLISHENEHARVKHVFDAENRLTSETINGRETTHEYDAMGNRTRRVSPLGNEIRYDYDMMGRTATVAINGAELAITRNELGLPVKETFGNGIERTYGSPVADQIVTLPGGNRIQRSYEYDPVGNLTARIDEDKGSSYFTYNPMRRITQSVDPENKIKKYYHDPAGNLLKHGTGDTGKGSRYLAHEGTEYHFNAAGNLVRRHGRGNRHTFDWNENNRLDRVVNRETGDETAMQYDSLGRRLLKATGSRTTTFLWDGDRLLSDSIGGGEREFVYYPGSFEPLAIIDETKAIHLIHTDSVGLPHEVTDEDGKIVWSASYNALGDLDKIHANDFNNPIRLQGQYYDPEIDLCYNRYRYFDAKTGSFVSKDPLGLAAGENVYSYAPNVWGWIDPLGLCRTSQPVLPPMSGPDNTFHHMQQGYLMNQYSSAMNSAFDSSNALWERGVYGVLALLTVPVAGVEEIARGIYNVPYDVVNAGKRLGERSARAGILADQGYYGDATLEGLYAVQDFSTGFTAAGTYAVPIAGALDSTMARRSVSAVADDAAVVADDVVSASKSETGEFVGTLKGEEVHLKGVKTRNIEYTKRSPEEANALRRKFDSTERKNFLKAISDDPKNVEQLRKAGFSEKEIARLKEGYCPNDQWQVHHKLPLDDGGTNDIDNLVLIKNDPFHKTITNEQNALTKGLTSGETITIDLPIPDGFVYPTGN